MVELSDGDASDLMRAIDDAASLLGELGAGARCDADRLSCVAATLSIEAGALKEALADAELNRPQPRASAGQVWIVRWRMSVRRMTLEGPMRLLARSWFGGSWSYMVAPSDPLGESGDASKMVWLSEAALIEEVDNG